MLKIQSIKYKVLKNDPKIPPKFEDHPRPGPSPENPDFGPFKDQESSSIDMLSTLEAGMNAQVGSHRGRSALTPSDTIISPLEMQINSIDAFILGSERVR